MTKERTAAIVIGSSRNAIHSVLVALTVFVWSGCSTDASSGVSPTNGIVSVIVSPGSASIAVAKTAQLAATPLNSAGEAVSGLTATWSSSSVGVATVSTDGLVTAVAVGTAVITARIDGVSGTATVTVSVSSIDRVTVTPSSVSIASGSTQAFTVAAYDAAGNVLANGGAISWASSNPSAATINSAGVASGVSAGLTTISATIQSVTGTATLGVTTAAFCKLVDGTRRVRESPLAKPGYLQSVVDPDFGTTITRITGDPGSTMPVVGGAWGTVVYGNYPKDAAWNADQSLLVLKHAGNRLLFLDGGNYQVLFARRGPTVIDARWHPTMPDIMVTVDSDGTVGYWNVRTNASTMKVRASGYSDASFGSYEGNPSYDGRFVVIQATRSSDRHIVAFVVDADGGTKGSDIDLTSARITDLDWVSISAGGGYVVAYATIDGATQRSKVWNARTGALVGYWQDFTFGHYDLGIDASGNEVAFGAVGQAPYAHHFIARRLDTGAITDLTGVEVTSYDWHAGTRNQARQGWGYGVPNDRTGFPFDGEIYAIKLDGSGTVERLAHHRANGVDYDSSPLPTPSPDGRRVLFSSNWGDPTGRPVQGYVVDTRQLCPNGLPQ
jgi:WD40 repeat protein